ncbi:MAG TPA: helix-turn-helix domain-containing protein [Chthonomonadaceae bacterium]|nr:helix-turn-helix domain-containing protein [Chthonomonadaceae bacterium]
MDAKGDPARLGAQLALELVSDKWTILIIHALKRGTKRYSELQREIEGVSQRMLIYTLRHMERDGLITRKVYPVVPPKTEYSLTPLGETLWEPLHNLCLWAEAHYDAVLEARRQSEADIGD